MKSILLLGLFAVLLLVSVSCEGVPTGATLAETTAALSMAVSQITNKIIEVAKDEAAQFKTLNEALSALSTSQTKQPDNSALESVSQLKSSIESIQNSISAQDKLFSQLTQTVSGGLKNMETQLKDSTSDIKSSVSSSISSIKSSSESVPAATVEKVDLSPLQHRLEELGAQIVTVHNDIKSATTEIKSVTSGMNSFSSELSSSGSSQEKKIKSLEKEINELRSIINNFIQSQPKQQEGNAQSDKLLQDILKTQQDILKQMNNGMLENLEVFGQKLRQLGLKYYESLKHFALDLWAQIRREAPIYTDIARKYIVQFAMKDLPKHSNTAKEQVADWTSKIGKFIEKPMKQQLGPKASDDIIAWTAIGIASLVGLIITLITLKIVNTILSIICCCRRRKKVAKVVNDSNTAANTQARNLPATGGIVKENVATYESKEHKEKPTATPAKSTGK